ncbi:MAG: aminoacyl--tRNA ligase-related protein [Chloroflexia bacterium]
MRRTMLFCETFVRIRPTPRRPGTRTTLAWRLYPAARRRISSLLPLGQRVRRKVEAILREEMDAAGGQGRSPCRSSSRATPGAGGRWQAIGPELARFRDRGDRDMVLAMTHEEAVTDLLRRRIRSYRQLPVMLYQIQTKFRDEPRAGAS